MPIKINKAANDFNVGASSIVEFLGKHGIIVDNNPNARISDEAYELLRKEYSKDRDVKEKSATIFPRRENKKNRRDQRPRNEDIKVSTPTFGPKVLGKIDIKTGKPIEMSAPSDDTKSETSPSQPEQTPAVVETSKPAEETTKPAEETTKPAETPTIVEEKPEPRQSEVSETSVSEPKPVETVQPKAETRTEPEAKETETPQPVAEPKEAAAEPAVMDNKPESEEKPASSASEDVPFRVAPKAETPQLKILGTIDLKALNTATRPPKKTREERRKERNERNRNGGGNAQGGSAQGSGKQSGNSERKKRLRIGMEKVDIEKAANQAGQSGSEKDSDRHGKRGKNDARKGGGGSDKNDSRRGNDNKKGGRGNSGDRSDRKGEKRRGPDSMDDSRQRKDQHQSNRPSKSAAQYRKEKRDEMQNRERQREEREKAESTILKLTEFVTANDLAGMMGIPVTEVIGTCFKLGVMVSINQRMDAETINIVASEFGFTTEFVSAEVSEAIVVEEDKEEDLEMRPPIVTVMGHVDHGKTSLLDYIRKANVIAGEAGGITQHIGAYNVELSDGRHITFLDTPGHEAFTAMRARGAKVTDLAIIIVAADDDVMPQTVEAINHASAAGVPIVFAINKIDKPTANPEKIKEELANMNYLVEEWGGKYQSQDISAKKGLGVDELMEKVLLEAEMLELKANPNRKAIGSVIESSLDKGRGYVATVLVSNGTLKVGDVVLAGTNYGKIKAMFNERNQRVTEAGPSTPVLILGLNGAPTAGDAFNVIETEQQAREIAAKREQLQRELDLRTKKRPGLDDLGRRMALKEFHELNLVVKGDVDGSIEALSDALIRLSTPEVQVNVLHKGVGAISESDVTLAAASDAIIIGFQVRPSAAARREAEKEGVEIRLYSVIYKAIEEVKDAMEGMLSPEFKEEITGTAEVLQTYHISKVGTIAGAIVREGKIKRTNKVRVIRDGIVIYTGDLGSLKRFKDDVKEVSSGYECGLSVQGYNDIREGDLIEGFEEVAVKKQL